MTDKTQALMNAAYARWQKARWQKADPKWSLQDFWDQLSAEERFAVFLGNLNYQVGNGGFSQWWGNGYATPETFGFIKRACKRIGTDAAREVGKLVKKAEKAIAGRAERDVQESEWEELHDTLSDLDTAFYAVNTQFLADVEAYLTKVPQAV